MSRKEKLNMIAAAESINAIKDAKSIMLNSVRKCMSEKEFYPDDIDEKIKKAYEYIVDAESLLMDVIFKER